ncbi:hypothetical protein CYME_CMB114C [Cyanidioschyzon merolae strain 10D]|uniref:Uncharacterized protein n=1 Tax=Cyanidioschyzon merolae (strain NIES-3377 / 10D) TaxID=280699 RepID=M1V3T4_CYAM1|nr:hypothetical protein CYME_CMB114C [Cyanidioschyzon merolae strain 10D]BAM78920.1 hypothetical protein CYME_CMB114C [Cyanidioschyzon merolae strain 10D]|eukprot:XP_005535206.1 hypothetical protein CYME_CMB114C [Cyanidioschyzon merolae strain 10D]
MRASVSPNYWSPRKRRDYVQSLSAMSSEEPDRDSELDTEGVSDDGRSDATAPISGESPASLPPTAPLFRGRVLARTDLRQDAESPVHTVWALLTHWVLQPMLVGASAAFGLSVGYAAFDCVSRLSPGSWFGRPARPFWTRAAVSGSKSTS